MTEIPSLKVEMEQCRKVQKLAKNAGKFKAKNYPIYQGTYPGQSQWSPRNFQPDLHNFNVVNNCAKDIPKMYKVV